MNIDHNKIRRESLRWLLLLALNHSRPINAHESLLLSVARGVYPDSTDIELRRELSYLEERKMVSIEKHPSGYWLAGLTALGVDIAEYTVPCHRALLDPKSIGRVRNATPKQHR